MLMSVQPGLGGLGWEAGKRDAEEVVHFAFDPVGGGEVLGDGIDGEGGAGRHGFDGGDVAVGVQGPVIEDVDAVADIDARDGGESGVLLVEEDASHFPDAFGVDADPAAPLVLLLDLEDHAAEGGDEAREDGALDDLAAALLNVRHLFVLTTSQAP